ncbi:hypothetical protein F4776DRAFT_647632 [Hypoxylon sp. NC0597]|nr:hypothetical protein F4776DRAFT_647632 [Hypoxylon sp. NC0597]
MSSKKDDHKLPTLKWTIPDISSIRAKADDCIKRTNWTYICEVASRTNGGQPCKALPKYTSGGTSLARLLEFQDGTYWVARVQLLEPTLETSRRLQNEVDTITLLKTNTRAPVPRIFAFNHGDMHTAGSAFVLLELLPGNSAMDEADGYHRTDWGLIPLQYRQTFYRSMAAAHVQIASARLPLIGTVSRDADGNFTVGPIPGIGGPFDTAASFIRAWAANIKYPYSEADLRKYINSPLIDEVIKGTYELPTRLANLAVSGKRFTRPGPFPIRHPDLFHNNVVVTESFDVLGIIDWGGAYTVPWELIDFPCFLSTVPRLLNPPSQYNEAGQPLNPNEIGMLADEKDYVAMVQEEEQRSKVDSMLSQTLADRDTQDLAGIVHLFPQGKMGLYGRALDYFENI